jgi:hypothetical protein
MSGSQQQVTRCPACGEVMTPENSRPSTFPTRRGLHELVCKDDKACAERYSGLRWPWRAHQ